MPVWLQGFAYTHSCLESQSDLLQIIRRIQQFKTSRQHNTRYIRGTRSPIPAVDTKLRFQHNFEVLGDFLQIIAFYDVTGAQAGRLFPIGSLEV